MCNSKLVKYHYQQNFFYHSIEDGRAVAFEVHPGSVAEEDVRHVADSRIYC